jgi:hypothetical protein
MKEYTCRFLLWNIWGKSFDVGSEGRISFSQQLHSTTISLQRNKASK